MKRLGLKRGDSVTVIVLFNHRLGPEAEYAEVRHDQFNGWYAGFQRLTPTGEGITWLRGHHAPDSPEVKALLASWILSR